MICNSSKNLGFTLIEVVIVVTILSVLSIITISNFNIFNKKADVGNNIQEFANVLKFAQNKTMSSENNSQYGVYINTSVSPNNYILFKGTSYATRDSSFDQSYSLTKNVEFSGITLGGGNEIVFNKLSGTSVQSGNISIRLISDISQIKTVYIANSGAIDFTLVSAPSDLSRVKDSRHIHFNYNRIIDTATENITLNFNNGTLIQSFPINAYLVGGEINLSKVFSVQEVDQTIEINTHSLNNPDTQFSIKRSRMLNDKSLKITISGDLSGNLIEYSADGLTVNGLTSPNCLTGGSNLSFYISNCNWQ